MKRQVNIYRTLAFLNWPELSKDCFALIEGERRIVKTGALAKRFHLSVERVKEHLEMLETSGFIKDLVVDRHISTLTLCTRDQWLNSLQGG